MAILLLTSAATLDSKGESFRVFGDAGAVAIGSGPGGRQDRTLRGTQARSEYAVVVRNSWKSPVLNSPRSSAARWNLEEK
jgi:hypothetical protein